MNCPLFLMLILVVWKFRVEVITSFLVLESKDFLFA